ncbi:ArsR family transcriptional regulator [Rathayibacter rathayi]|uniref:ArsR family transcriptional regulator n=1 Tax=Rathayibacter rathayi TaxID=33887 RepID=A0ABD6WAK4_RATRA|nr:metalloregulator ArsR/SmtB family transcription factor [Rathayibacter rathayi]AZZ48555.1 ArsR family transcriptional regulator [Rathayibacter rathayi]MWV74866.1 metalloregulator ArsR/SmtB family transcription factor [Rathayibacter rathayi NCPPB 2980 = VKM Ac-1601]PPF14721.1 ArsR family transcriptional regulator [Rathayibacter rathayi]PPF24411.1 ArsR family transcriptional regulator [Rathayibacter rathayi]PPF49950.1 ArsR family transcriptional regulator [Rathayibacter rathayi]
MVVQADPDVDRLFRALADGTRRDIVARVLVGEQSVSALATRYDMSFAAVQKHVAVLERATLVRKRRSGREQLVRGEVAAVQRVSRLLDAYEQLWRGRVDRRSDFLNEE